MRNTFFIRTVIPAMVIIVNIGLASYFIISNAQNFERYATRASYTVRHVANTTTDYYIVRDDMNDTSNCPPNALFTFDVTAVYNNIISKQGENKLFVTVYWLSTVVAILLSIFDISVAVMAQLVHHHAHHESLEEPYSFLSKAISTIGSQLLQKGSFIFPTYFITIFDFTQMCLPNHTKASAFILEHTYIGIVISLCGMVYLILWTVACWDSRRHQYLQDIIWIKCLDVLTRHHERASVTLFVLLCSAVIPIGAYDIFVWITSLMEFILTSKAVLIGFHFILGIVHSVLRHCQHSRNV